MAHFCRFSVLAILLVVSASIFAGSGQVDRVQAPADGVYIVRLNPTTPSDSPAREVAAALISKAGGAASHSYETVFRGFRFVGSPTAAEAISRDPRVMSVQQASRIVLAGVQTPAPSWGLDRIDQAIYPLDNSYTYNYTGMNTVIYIIDSGVSTFSDVRGRLAPISALKEFRARRVIPHR